MSQWTIDDMKTYLNGKIETLKKDTSRSNYEKNCAKIEAYTDALFLLMDWNGQ